MAPLNPTPSFGLYESDFDKTFEFFKPDPAIYPRRVKASASYGMRYAFDMGITLTINYCTS